MYGIIRMWLASWLSIGSSPPISGHTLWGLIWGNATGWLAQTMGTCSLPHLKLEAYDQDVMWLCPLWALLLACRWLVSCFFCPWPVFLGWHPWCLCVDFLSWWGHLSRACPDNFIWINYFSPVTPQSHVELYHVGSGRWDTVYPITL